MGANAQVALEKFARYFDVECRLVPVSVKTKYRLDPKKAMQYVDENTIGIFVILGSMLFQRLFMIFYGPDIQAPTRDIMSLSRKWLTYWMNMNRVLAILFLFTVGFGLTCAVGLLCSFCDIVDAASGGFVAPFVTVCVS